MIPKSARTFTLDQILAGELGPLALRLSKVLPAGAEEDWVLGDFTECDFDGYSAATVHSFAAAALDGTFRAESLSALYQWTAGAAIVAQNIKAIYFTIETFGPTYHLFWCAKVSPFVTLSVPGEKFKRKIDFYLTDLVI